MNIFGQANMTVGGSSSASGSLPPYLNFYLMLDVSGSMGLPSTNAEQTRLSGVNPDDFSVYPNVLYLRLPFSAAKGSYTNPATGQTTNTSGSAYSAYPTSTPPNPAISSQGYCMGYLISRVGPTAWNNLLVTNSNYPMKGKSLPSAILTNANSNVAPGALNSLITGNTNSLPNSLTAVTSCPTEGATNCIQLRADAVGFALNATQAANGVSGLFETANNKQIIANQYRIGLFPFIRYLWTYFDLTSTPSTETRPIRRPSTMRRPILPRCLIPAMAQTSQTWAPAGRILKMRFRA